MLKRTLLTLFDPEHRRLLVAAYVVLDVFLVGLGMGVPIFCILFGFPIGWIVVWQSRRHRKTSEVQLRDLLKKSAGAALITFLFMVATWGQFVRLLIEASPDFGIVGMPMILYEPKPSFVAWLVLTILVSPVLQLLSSVFSGVLCLAYQPHVPPEACLSP
jgi:hypothetical protein